MADVSLNKVELAAWFQFCNFKEEMLWFIYSICTALWQEVGSVSLWVPTSGHVTLQQLGEGGLRMASFLAWSAFKGAGMDVKGSVVFRFLFRFKSAYVCLFLWQALNCCCQPWVIPQKESVVPHIIFLPAYAAWTTELGNLQSHLIPTLLNKIEKLQGKCFLYLYINMIIQVCFKASWKECWGNKG